MNEKNIPEEAEQKPAPESENLEQPAPEQEAPEQDVQEQEAQEQEGPAEEFPKSFSLNYRISQEDYFKFQLSMSRDQIARNSKKNTILGWVELSLGLLYIIVSLATTQTVGPLQLILSLILVVMGVYGITYFKYFFEKQLRKASGKQYQNNTYFQNEVWVDFYPNKCVEHLRDTDNKVTPYENFWHSIDSVRSDEDFIMIMLEAKRCLLIPKGQVAQQGMLDRLEGFLNEICENFEKPRVYR